MIVDPANIPTLGKFDDSEFEVLLYEFKADLNEYLSWLGPAAPVHSLKDVIAFNEAQQGSRAAVLRSGNHDDGREERAADEPGVQSRAGEESPAWLARCGIDAVMTKYKPRRAGRADGRSRVADRSRQRRWRDRVAAGAVIGRGGRRLSAHHGAGRDTFGACPSGMSFFGRAWSEPTLIKLAYAYEQATRHRRPPTFAPTADLRDDHDSDPAGRRNGTWHDSCTLPTCASGVNPTHSADRCGVALSLPLRTSHWRFHMVMFNRGSCTSGRHSRRSRKSSFCEPLVSSLEVVRDNPLRRVDGALPHGAADEERAEPLEIQRRLLRLAHRSARARRAERAPCRSGRRRSRCRPCRGRGTRGGCRARSRPTPNDMPIVPCSARMTRCSSGGSCANLPLRRSGYHTRPFPRRVQHRSPRPMQQHLDEVRLVADRIGPPEHRVFRLLHQRRNAGPFSSGPHPIEEEVGILARTSAARRRADR